LAIAFISIVLHLAQYVTYAHRLQGRLGNRGIQLAQLRNVRMVLVQLGKSEAYGS